MRKKMDLPIYKHQDIIGRVMENMENEEKESVKVSKKKTKAKQNQTKAKKKKKRKGRKQGTSSDSPYSD